MNYECSKTDHEARKRWARRHSLRFSNRQSAHWRAILGRAWPSLSRDELARGEWDDHGEVWNRDGRPACYTSQPYDLSTTARDELDSLAGVRVEIRPKAESWYYPGGAWLVILWRPE